MPATLRRLTRRALASFTRLDRLFTFRSNDPDRKAGRVRLELAALEDRVVPSTWVTLERLADGAEPGTPGAFRLVRSGDPGALDGPLTVALLIGGTATRGTDYTLPGDTTTPTGGTPGGGYLMPGMPGSGTTGGSGSNNTLSVTFMPEQAVYDLSVTVLDDTLSEGPESVTAQLQGTVGPTPEGPSYVIGNADPVTVWIADDETQTGTGGSGTGGSGTTGGQGLETDADPAVKGEPATFWLSADPDTGATVEWDANYDGESFQPVAGASDTEFTTTFTAVGSRTVAARVTGTDGSVQIMTLGITVEAPPPEVTVPDDVTAVAGTPTALQVTVPADVQVASVQWSFSYDGEDYEVAPSATTLTPDYTFELAGEYDAWVVVTDTAGKTGEGGFHISVQDAAPVAQVTVTRLGGQPIGTGIDEGQTVTFTVNDLSPDDLDTTTVYVDWTGTGVFDQLNETDVDFVVDPGNPRVLRFNHRYDDNSAAEGFSVSVRTEDEWGVSDYDPVNLVVRNVAPTVTVTAGQQFATVATSGRDVWALQPGQDLQMTAFDPSNADTATLVYNWTVTDDATDQVVSQVPTGTDNPGGSAFLPLPSYQAGKIYRVEAFVTDKNGDSSPVTKFTVEVDAPNGYGVPGAGSHWLPNRVYGTMTVDDLPAPAVYNRYAMDVRVSPVDPEEPGKSNWAAGQNIVAHFTLDADSLALAQTLGATIDYRFAVAVYDVEQFSVGSNNHNLLPAQSFFVHGASNTLTVPGVGEDREVDIVASADLVVNGQVVRTTSLADFERNANSNFGMVVLLHQPTAVLITPKTQTTWRQVVDVYQAVRDLAQQFGDKAQKLIDAVTSNPQGVFDILSGAFVGAVKEFGKNLVDPNPPAPPSDPNAPAPPPPKSLLDRLAGWLGGGVNVSQFAGLNWSDTSTWGSFLLQYAGLTWDHVYDVVRQQLGAGNLAAVEGVAAWFTANGGGDLDPTKPASILTFLQNIKDKVPEIDLGDLDATTLIDKAIAEAGKRIPAALAKAGAQMAAKFVPGAGMAVSLLKGLQWVLDSKDQLTETFNKFLSAIDDVYDATRPGGNPAAAIPRVQAKLVAGFDAAVEPLLNFAASQLGIDRLRGELQKALGFIPQKVDAALRKAVDAVAAKVTAAVGGAAGGTAAVPGGTKDGTAALFNGRLAAAREFAYQNKTYVLWVAQDKGGVKVFVAEKTGAGHKLIGELTAKSFAGDGPKGHLTALGAAAKALHTASKTKSAPGANPVTDLKAKQAAVTAAEDVVVQDILANACVALNAGCFAAGTKLLTKRGWVPVELLEPGDEVAARDERDPAGAVEWKPVEDTFRRTGRVLHLHFPGGELIRTTPEHPFWVEGQGWTPAGALHEGDRLATLVGDSVPLGEVFDTEEWEPVYNLRVAEHHTYFVGDDHWGFAAWAHNAYLHGANATLTTIGEAYVRRALMWRNTIPAQYTGNVVAVSELNGKEIVYLYAMSYSGTGTAPTGYTPQAEIAAFIARVNASGGSGHWVSYRDHAESTLYSNNRTVSVIGVTDRPCPTCRNYFANVVNFNNVWFPPIS